MNIFFIVILSDSEESLRCFASLNMTGLFLRRFAPQHDSLKRTGYKRCDKTGVQNRF